MYRAVTGCFEREVHLGENNQKCFFLAFLGLKIIFLGNYKCWAPGFYAKIQLFIKNSLGWSWNFDLFWGPQEPYGSFRYQNSRNMYNYDIISYVIKLLQVKYAAKSTVLMLQKCYAPKKWMPECPRETEVAFNTTCAIIRV